MTLESGTTDARLEISIELPLDRFVLNVEHTTDHRVLGVFGPSGSGKTSLLSALAGLVPGTRGRIRLGDRLFLDTERGIDVAPESRGVGYVPQDGLLFPHLDVRQNLLAGAARAKGQASGVAPSLDRVSDLLELGPLLDSDVASLSGGERQRVALGRALCSGPRLLLLDEPMASLDRPLRGRVLPFLRRTCEELDVPVVLVSHEPIEVQALCDELLVLNHGSVVARGPTRQVLTDPEIFGLEGEDGFQNLLPCRVAEDSYSASASKRGAVTEVLLGDGQPGVRLIASQSDAPAGAELFVNIPAHEIILALGRPEGVSALNVLPAEIVSITELGDQRLVTSSIGDGCPPMSAMITDRACDQLGLEPGRSIFLIIKTTCCRLLGA